MNSAINPIWIKRPCPLCGSLEHEEKANSRAKNPAETMSWKEVKNYFIGLRNNQVFFSYYRCVDCGLLYCPWFFSASQLSELYAEMPDNTMGEDKSIVSKTQSAYAKWIMKPGVSNRRYLEVGPDIGLVSKEIIEIRLPDHVTLLEPNLSIRDELKQNVKLVSSVEVIGSIEEMTHTNFNLVAGIHVYDHLLNPLRDLRELRKNVVDGGHLAIVVHNEKSILRKILRKKWPPFCLQHPQLYNPTTLTKILQLSGWRVEAVEKSVNWYHLQHFVRLGAGVLGIPVGVSRIAPNMEVAIKLGNFSTLSEAC
jgi:hypothetical protein